MKKKELKIKTMYNEVTRPCDSTVDSCLLSVDLKKT